MKAVVLEIKDGYAAVLSEDGQFRKIKDEGYSIGMELTLEKTENRERKNFGKLINFRSRFVWSGMATVAAALLIFIGVKDFNTPYGTISLDVNPSIEISINRYDRVLSIEAVNDDASEIVDTLNSSGVKYKSVEDAVEMALNSLSEGDYAADDGTTYVMISANSESDKHSDKIANELDSICSEHEDISAQTITADDELLERAKKSGTTAGKLYLVDKLKSASGEEDFDESDWLKKPVKDIMRKIDELEEPSQDEPNVIPPEGQGELNPKDEASSTDEDQPNGDLREGQEKSDSKDEPFGIDDEKSKLNPQEAQNKFDADPREPQDQVDVDSQGPQAPVDPDSREPQDQAPQNQAGQDSAPAREAHDQFDADSQEPQDQADADSQEPQDQADADSQEPQDQVGQGSAPTREVHDQPSPQPRDNSNTAPQLQKQ